MENKKKQIVFGLGPGKSGTKTLAAFFNQQSRMIGVHEGRFLIANIFSLIPFFPDIVHYENDYQGIKRHLKKMQILAMLRQLVTGKEVTHISESAMYFISYVDQILQDFPDAKFICIERDHEKTLKSWMGITKNNVCHWSTGGTKGYWPFFTKIIGRHWDRCFPKYNLPHEEACRKYIEDYYDQVRLLQNKYPKNILIVSMDDFTSKQESRLEIFNFIGYKGMRNFNVPHEHKNRDFLKFFSGKI